MKILIGTPICEAKNYCWGEWVEAIKGLVSPSSDDVIRVLLVDNSDKEDQLRKQVEEAGFNYVHVKADRPMDKVVKSRNMVFEFAEKLLYDFVFFIDSDVIVQPDTLIKLYNSWLKQEGGIVSGNYTITTKHGLPTPAAKYKSKRTAMYKNFPTKYLDNKTHLVDLVGLGCCLIPRHIVLNSKFRCERNNKGKLTRSEDMCYFDDNYYPVWYDTSADCKHVIGDQFQWGENS